MKGIQIIINYEARTEATVNEIIITLAKTAVDNYS